MVVKVKKWGVCFKDLNPFIIFCEFTNLDFGFGSFLFGYGALAGQALVAVKIINIFQNNVMMRLR